MIAWYPDLIDLLYVWNDYPMLFPTLVPLQSREPHVLFVMAPKDQLSGDGNYLRIRQRRFYFGGEASMASRLRVANSPTTYRLRRRSFDTGRTSRRRRHLSVRWECSTRSMSVKVDNEETTDCPYCLPNCSWSLDLCVTANSQHTSRISLNVLSFSFIRHKEISFGRDREAHVHSVAAAWIYVFDSFTARE